MAELPEIPGFHFPDKAGLEAILQRLKVVTNTSSDRALSLSLGLHHSAVSVAKTRNLVPATWVLEANRRFKASTSWILGDTCGQSYDDFCFLPILEPALTADSELDQSEPIDWHLFKRSWLDSKGQSESLRLLRVNSSAMEPSIQDQDMVLVNIEMTEAKSEWDIFLVAFNQSVFIRRILMEPGKMVMRSENSKLVPDIDVSLDDRQLVKILGKVIWWAHEEKI